MSTDAENFAKAKRVIIILRDALINTHKHLDLHHRDKDETAKEEIRAAVGMADHHIEKWESGK